MECLSKETAVELIKDLFSSLLGRQKAQEKFYANTAMD